MPKGSKSIQKNEGLPFSKQKWLFIMGIPRSGTTWLLSIFEKHSQCLALTPQMLDISVEAPTKETGLFFRGLTNVDILERIQKLPTDRLLIEKTPSHLLVLPEIKETIPDVDFLLIQRNSLDVICSMMQKNTFWKDSPQSFEDAVELYLKFYEAQLKYNTIFNFKIFYEELWSNPLEVLSPIFTSLKLDTSSLNSIIEQTWGGKSLQQELKSVFRKGEPGEGQSFFTRDQKNYVQEKIKLLKKQFSYSAPAKVKENLNFSKNKKPLKILIALNYFKELTGSETYTLLLVKHLLNYGHEVEIYAHVGFGPPLYNGLPFLKIWTKDNIITNYNAYDIIITQHATTTNLILNKFKSTPAISVNHGIISEENPQLAPNLIHYICVSDEVARRAQEQFMIPEKRISVIPNPIDLDYYKFSDEIQETKNFLWAGSIYDWKIKSLDAAIRITQSLKGAKLFVAGQNSINLNFQNIDHVQYLGVQNITPEFLNRFCMVFGVGRLALEALAVGTPVYIMGKDGIDGLLDQSSFFNFRNYNFSGRYNPINYHEADFHSIAEKIGSLISNHGQLKSLKKQYSELRKEIDSSRIVKLLEKKLYEIYQYNSSDIFSFLEEKEISIIIPVYNQINYTKKCLEAISKHTPAVKNFEVIIVNNGSTDETEQYLEQAKTKFSNLRVIQNYQNLGFARACNIGANAAYGKYLIFLNNDTEPQPDWLEEILKLYKKEENVGIIGSKLLYPDRSVQHAGIEFHYRVFGNSKLPWPYHEFRGVNENFSEVNITREVTAVTGACLFISRQLFKEVGGMDETYPMYFEDIDLNMKVRQLGKKVWYCSKSVVIHYEGKSSLYQKDIDEKNLKSGETFIKRWGKEVKVLLDSQMKIKNHLIWSAPFFNPSGYASEAIGFAIGLDKYCDLQIYHANPIRSKNFLENMPPHWRETLSRLHSEDPYATSIKIPENIIFISHQPANSFVTLDQAKYNIGRTMFETDRIPGFWKKHCDKMDEIWVPSQFNYETFTKSGIDSKKIKVIPESIDTSVFDPEIIQPLDLPKKAAYNFLSIFEWTERKGWDVLLRAYFEAFTKDDDVCLFLRTYLLGHYDEDSENIIQSKINELINRNGYSRKKLPAYVIMSNQLPFEAMLRLYKSVDVFVLPSRGEGWGRPYMEAMCMGLPVIGTNWSGNTAFMNEKNSFLIKIDGLDEIKKMEIPFYIGHKWAKPSKNHLKKLLREVHQNPDLAKQKAHQARKDILEKFSLDAVSRWVIRRLQEIEENLENSKVKPIPDSSGLPNTANEFNIIWEGDQFVHHSLALVNRELSLQLIESDVNLSILPLTKDTFKPGKNSPYQKIMSSINKPLSKVDVHIRHHWPPNLIPPETGHWVIIQPWEFGSLPQKWVEVFSTKVDEMWVPSCYVRDIYIQSGIPAERVFVIPNGINPNIFNIDVQPFKLSTKKRFKFLFVGGTIYRKGIDLLLEAYLQTFTQSDNVCLVIKDMGSDSVYRGQTFEDYIYEIKNKKGAPEIEYIKKILPSHQLAGLYRACNLLVHPYRGEGFGLPILEAMACGIAPLVTEGGAAMDFCNKENSMLVVAKKITFAEKRVDNMITVDTPWLFEVDLSDLKEKMRFAYQHPKKIQELGIRAAGDAKTKWIWKKSADLVKGRVGVLKNKPIIRFEPVSTPNKESFPVDLSIYYIKAEQAFQKKEYDAALQHLKTVVEINPKFAEAYCLLGLIYFIQEDFKGALSFFEIAIQLKPDFLKAQHNYAKTQFALKMEKEAIKTCLTIIKNHPEDWETKLLLAEIFEEKNQLAKALQLVKDILSERPKEIIIWERYAKLTKSVGDMVEYQIAIEKYLELNPVDSVAMNELGVLHWQKNNFEIAVLCFEQAVKLNGNHPEHIKNLADAYIAIARFEEGIKLYRLMIEIYPNDFEAYEKLSALYVESGNRNAAKKLIRKYLSKNENDPKALQFLNLLENSRT